jgi:Alginate export
VGRIPGDSYLLQRLQWHVGVHINENWQVFTQFEDVRAPGKRIITPVDENPLELRLAYLAYTREFSEGTFKARVGRQDFLFDLQRFVRSADSTISRSVIETPCGRHRACMSVTTSFSVLPVPAHLRQVSPSFSRCFHSMSSVFTVELGDAA